MANRPAAPNTMRRESPPCVNPTSATASHPSSDACRAHPLKEAHRRVVHLHRLLQDLLLPAEVQIDLGGCRSRLLSVAPR
eukprot:2968568-Prymnesium_polylepis.1